MYVQFLMLACLAFAGSGRRMQRHFQDAKSELATDPAATASLNKIGYIGSPGNLVDLEIKGTICTVLSGLASRGFQVYVGTPNEALRSVAPVKVKDMQTAGAAMFDAVIVLPGGSAARDEAQRFSGKTKLFLFVNSASEHGRPEWFNALSIEETFDLTDMQTDVVVETIFKSLERPSPTSGNSTQDGLDSTLGSQSLLELKQTQSSVPLTSAARAPKTSTIVTDVGSVLLFPVKVVTGVVAFGAAVLGVIGEETPSYKVEASRSSGNATLPSYEVRRYGAYQAIRTTGKSGGSDSQDFMALAGYIGVMGPARNADAQKISMTTPVISTFRGEKRPSMIFTLPSQVENPPRPLDKDVKSIRRPETLWAVHRYRGSWNRREAETAADALRKRVIADGKQVDSTVAWEWWRYNPPFTLPWLRTNEVAIKLVA